MLASLGFTNQPLRTSPEGVFNEDEEILTPRELSTPTRSNRVTDLAAFVNEVDRWILDMHHKLKALEEKHRRTLAGCYT